MLDLLSEELPFPKNLAENYKKALNDVGCYSKEQLYDLIYHEDLSAATLVETGEIPTLAAKSIVHKIIDPPLDFKETVEDIKRSALTTSFLFNKHDNLLSYLMNDLKIPETAAVSYKSAMNEIGIHSQAQLFELIYYEDVTLETLASTGKIPLLTCKAIIRKMNDPSIKGKAELAREKTKKESVPLRSDVDKERYNELLDLLANSYNFPKGNAVTYINALTKIGCYSKAQLFELIHHEDITVEDMVNTGEIPNLAAKTILRKVKTSKEYGSFVQKTSGINNMNLGELGFGGITGSGVLGVDDEKKTTEKRDECIQM